MHAHSHFASNPGPCSQPARAYALYRCEALRTIKAFSWLTKKLSYLHMPPCPDNEVQNCKIIKTFFLRDCSCKPLEKMFLLSCNFSVCRLAAGAGMFTFWSAGIWLSLFSELHTGTRRMSQSVRVRGLPPSTCIWRM